MQDFLALKNKPALTLGPTILVYGLAVLQTAKSSLKSRIWSNDCWLVSNAVGSFECKPDISKHSCLQCTCFQSPYRQEAKSDLKHCRHLFEIEK